MTYQIAARVYDPAVPSKMLVGPYLPHADLNLTGRVRFDVPYPLPLDPAADLPPQLLGSAWVVAAGPGRAQERSFQGAPAHLGCQGLNRISYACYIDRKSRHVQCRCGWGALREERSFQAVLHSCSVLPGMLHPGRDIFIRWGCRTASLHLISFSGGLRHDPICT